MTAVVGKPDYSRAGPNRSRARLKFVARRMVQGFANAATNDALTAATTLASAAIAGRIPFPASPLSGDVLKWNGTAWVAATPVTPIF